MISFFIRLLFKSLVASWVGKFLNFVLTKIGFSKTGTVVKFVTYAVTFFLGGGKKK